MRIWNLTPHTMHYDDGTAEFAFESDGVLRLCEVDELAEPVAGLVTVHKRYGEVQGLPAGIVAGDVLLVSTLIGDAWPDRLRPTGVTVLVPDTGASCRRDAHGRIVSVSRFVRK